MNQSLNNDLSDSNAQSFGIGSFIFSINLEKATPIEDVVLELANCLKSIPGLSKLRIEPDFDSPRRIPKGSCSLGFLNIRFELDLSTDKEFSDTVNTFEIFIQSFFDIPVTIVSGRDFINPSGGVIRTREYIKKYLRGACSLDVTGPSPFHADFYAKKSSLEFRVNVDKKRGYDNIIIYSTKNSYSDIYKEFFEEVGDELNLFYLIREIETAKIKAWDKIYSKVEGIRHSNNSALRKKMKDWYYLNQRITEIMQLIIDFESNLLSHEQLIEERLTETYSTGKKHLYQYIEKEKSEVYKYPIDSVEKLIKFYITQRYHLNQRLVALASAIIGGLVATVLTPLFK